MYGLLTVVLSNEIFFLQACAVNFFMDVVRGMLFVGVAVPHFGACVWSNA